MNTKDIHERSKLGYIFYKRPIDKIKRRYISPEKIPQSCFKHCVLITITSKSR